MSHRKWTHEWIQNELKTVHSVSNGLKRLRSIKYELKKTAFLILIHFVNTFEQFLFHFITVLTLSVIASYYVYYYYLQDTIIYKWSVYGDVEVKCWLCFEGYFLQAVKTAHTQLWNMPIITTQVIFGINAWLNWIS